MKKLQLELSHYSILPKQFVDPKSKYFSLTDKEKMVWVRLFDLWKQAHAEGNAVIKFRDKKSFSKRVLGITRQSFYKIFKTFSNMGLLEINVTDLGYYEITMYELEDEELYAKPKARAKSKSFKKPEVKHEPRQTENDADLDSKETFKPDILDNATETNCNVSKFQQPIIYTLDNPNYGFVANGDWIYSSDNYENVEFQSNPIDKEELWKQFKMSEMSL